MEMKNIIGNVKVSVIIPVYNAEKYLNQCLDSLKAQTFKQFEVICVDDGSTDASREILGRYSVEDSRFRIFQQKNSGAGAARNYGMEYARGEYLYFMDADDFLEETLLEEAFNKAEEEQADIVLFSARFFDTRSGTSSETESSLRLSLLPEDKPAFSAEECASRIFQLATSAPWNKLFRREFISDEGLQFVNQPNTNDLTFVLAAMALAKRISYLPDQLYFYRIGMSTNTQSQKDKNPTCFITALLILRDILEKKGKLNQFEKSWVWLFYGCCVGYLNTMKMRKSHRIIYERLMEEDVQSTGVFSKSPDYYSEIVEYPSICDFLSGPVKYEPVNSRNLREIKRRIDERRPTVSVIVPVYNTEQYVEECLDSILNQTLENIELICVNDGSKDRSLSLVEEKCKDDSRITILSQNNSGISAARNAGYRIAQGKYLLFVDSDDCLKRNALDELVSRAEQESLDILLFGGETIFDNKELRETNKQYDHLYEYHDWYGACTSGEELLTELLRRGEYKSSACMQLVRKAVLDANGLCFYEGITHEDELYTLRVLMCAAKAGVSPQQYYIRRIRSNSIITGENLLLKTLSFFTCYTEGSKYAAQAKLSQQSKESVSSLLNMFLFDVVKPSYFKLPEAEKQWFELYLNQEQWFFWKTVQNSFERERRAVEQERRVAEQERRAAEQERMTAEWLRQEVERLKQEGMTAERGRVAWFMGKLTGGYYCLKEHGIAYTVNNLIGKVKRKIARSGDLGNKDA